MDDIGYIPQLKQEESKRLYCIT